MLQGIMLQCRIHFQLALRYNDSPAEIAWIATYYLAKISEKLGDDIDIVCICL